MRVMLLHKLAEDIPDDYVPPAEVQEQLRLLHERSWNCISEPCPASGHTRSVALGRGSARK